MTRTLPILLAALSLSGCTFDEDLVIENMTGTIVLPEAAGMREFVREDGETETISDVRLIGPVYLGMYSDVEEGLENYPHPWIGPQYEEGVPGDTFPYGGTTVGDFRYACFSDLACKITSGRFQTYDHIVDWFGETLESPIIDNLGNEVTNGDYIRQTCYNYLRVTTDEEVRITATDENEDGVIDANDLDFVQGSDGKWRASFIFWQQEYFEEASPETPDDPAGMSLWGFMDSPSERLFTFSTCNPANGYQEFEYNNDFFAGTQFPDILNFPSQYIGRGDWVACGMDENGDCAEPGYEYESPFDTPEIHIDLMVQ